MTNGEHLPANPEITNLMKEAQQNSSFEKRLTFNGNSGIYKCEGQEIPHGTRVVAHCLGWAQEWIKFVDRKFIERMIYRVSRGDKIPTRDQLGDNDEKLWVIGRDKQPQDPWNLRHLLPMWDPESDAAWIFVTPSKSGQRAVSDLVTIYGRRAQRQPDCGQPIIKLHATQFKTAGFGNMYRPSFDVVGWDDGKMLVREVSDDALKDADFNDEIPF